MNRIIRISFWVIGVVAVVVFWVYLLKNQSTMKLREPIININDETGYQFVDRADILAQIINVNDSASLIMGNINVNELEIKVTQNKTVKAAEVYKTIDGDLVVDVQQRRPIVRVFSNNKSYYIDEDGWLMPTSIAYTARVLVVSGNLMEINAKQSQFNYAHLNDTLKPKTLLDDIYEISKYIDESAFWKAQIEQVYVNKELEFVLVPKVGNHKIVFGGIDNLKGKFEKLMIFYERGLSRTGWNEYSQLNLKYENQVVCTKKYN